MRYMSCHLYRTATIQLINNTKLFLIFYSFLNFKLRFCYAKNIVFDALLLIFDNIPNLFKMIINILNNIKNYNQKIYKYIFYGQSV